MTLSFLILILKMEWKDMKKQLKENNQFGLNDTWNN